MSKLFQGVSDNEGVRSALNSGAVSALVFAGMTVLGIVLLLATKQLPTGEAATDATASFVGIGLEATFALITAWRFKIGKGLVFGSLLVLLFAAEVVMKITSGTTNVGWMFLYAAVFIGLLNGLRGAWAARRTPKPKKAKPS